MSWFYIFIVMFAIMIVLSKGVYRVLLGILLVAYIGVEYKLNNNVRLASHHANTIHGWYSKENSTEKFLVKAWIFGYPIGVLIVSGYLLGKREEKIDEI